MEPNFDVKSASDFLDSITSKRAETMELDTHIPQLGQTKLTDYEVVKFDSPQSWRLTRQDDNNTEVIFRMQGILCAFELPPVTSMAKNTDKKRLFIRQAVRLTGLSTDAFGQAAAACEAVHAKMTPYFPDGSLNPWQNTLYEGHTAIDFNARYFTLRKNAPNEPNLPFSEGVDPLGVLAKLRKHDLLHGPDNKVAYLKLFEDGRYCKIEPGTFQVGDIVEVTFAFVTIAIGSERYIMIPQLRALTLLDSDIRQVANQRPTDIRSCKSAVGLKRKILYVTEDLVDETRDKVAKMHIDRDAVNSGPVNTN